MDSSLLAVPRDALRAYLDNPAFRSAEGHELILDRHPFHRPVRPQDLDMLAFDPPLQAERCCELSALMTQRMLLNIHEADCAFLCDAGPPQQELDRAAFYGDESRLRGAAVRPFLEHYAFGWLAEPSPAAPTGELFESARRSLQATAGVAPLLRDRRDPERVAQMLLIQLGGPLLSRQLAFARQQGGVDWSGRLGPLRAALAQAATDTLAATPPLLAWAGLPARPHACWQFYLGSWLALANFAHGLVRRHDQPWRVIGAQLYDRLWSEVLGRRLHDALPQGLGRLAMPDWPAAAGPAQQWVDLVLTAAAGEPGAEAELRAGFDAMRRLHAVADRDLALQVDWSDDLDRQRELAAEYVAVIAAAPFAVGMETYVEPSSERSTTHVHDSDRLLVIESGEMDFWPSYGPPLHLRAGDRLYVPRHRLHGSVVTSDECRYHQPIIDDRVAALHGRSS